MSILGTQFIHIEAHSVVARGKARGVHSILDEADREPASCIHVKNAKKPIIIFGSQIRDLRKLHDDAAKEARLELQNGKVRRIRRDQLTMLSVVVSCTLSAADIVRDNSLMGPFNDWCQKVTSWLKKRYSSQLKTIALHYDEAFLHLHAFLLPESPSMSASTLHPGLQAKSICMKESIRRGESKKIANRRGNIEYCAAMRKFQDEYSDQVGIACGQARIGPGRLRLPRAEALQVRDHYARIQKVHQSLEGKAQELERRENWLDSEKARLGIMDNAMPGTAELAVGNE